MTSLLVQQSAQNVIDARKALGQLPVLLKLDEPSKDGQAVNSGNNSNDLCTFVDCRVSTTSSSGAFPPAGGYERPSTYVCGLSSDLESHIQVDHTNSGDSDIYSIFFWYYSSGTSADCVFRGPDDASNQNPGESQWEASIVRNGSIWQGEPTEAGGVTGYHTSATLSNSQWVFCVLSYRNDSGTIEFYPDASDISSGTQTSFSAVNKKWLSGGVSYIGKPWEDSVVSNYMNGFISFFGIVKGGSILSDDEITALYEGTKINYGHTEPPLINFVHTYPLGGSLEWVAVTNATRYKIEYYKTSEGEMSKKVFSEGLKTESVIMTGLEPETSYTLILWAYINGTWYRQVPDVIHSTACEDTAGFNTMMTSSKKIKTQNLRNGGTIQRELYDLSALNVEDVCRMKKRLQDMDIQTGEHMMIPLKKNGTQSTHDCILCKRGETIDCDTALGLEDSTVYIPFEQDAGSSQKVHLLLGGVSQCLEYDEVENTITLDSRKYGIGDRFFVTLANGQTKGVTVVSGSIALVFANDTPILYPWNHSKITKQSQAGSGFCRHMSSRKLFMLGGNDTVPGVMQSSIPFYGYDSTTGSTDPSVHTQEGFRMTHTLDNAGEVGTMTWMGLREDSESNKVLETVLETEAAQTKFRATDDTGSKIVTVDNTGVWADSDDWALYFGDQNQFRLRFNNDLLSLEATPNNSSTAYAPKMTLTRS